MLMLEDNPRPSGCRKLFDHIHRIRIGAYRVICKSEDERKQV